MRRVFVPLDGSPLAEAVLATTRATETELSREQVSLSQ